MSFTEQDMKKQMEDFAALREEFSRLESQEKAMRKQLDLPEREKTDPSSLTPKLREMVEEAMAEARRAAQARTSLPGVNTQIANSNHHLTNLARGQ